MSAADPAVAVRPVRRVSTRLLRSELWLIFGRRRNQAGLLVLTAVPVLIAVAIRVSSPTRDELAGAPAFLESILGNGMFVALAALNAALPILLPLAVAAISGDTVAGEANIGTLRYLLAVPVHRTRLLAVKYTAVVIFCFVATAWMALVGVLAGLALFGGGPVALLSGEQVPLAAGLLRLLAVCAYLGMCLAALGAIGMFVSTLTEQPIGAAIAILTITVVGFVLGSIPQLDWLHPYLFTHWWMVYGDLLREPVVTDKITSGVLSAGAYALIFLTAAWARFAGRDVTS